MPCANLLKAILAQVLMASELTEYIYQQQRAGFSNEEIRNQLRSNGWKEDVLAAAFNETEELHEGRRWTVYSVASIVLIFIVSLAIVGVAKVTGFVPGGDVTCLVENPKYPGYYNFVQSPEDCLKLALANYCKPLGERLDVKSQDKVLFEGAIACKGTSNLYFPKQKP